MNNYPIFVSEINSVKMSKASYEPVTKIDEGHRELLKSIGTKLEEIRVEKKISVTTLCKNVGMSRTTYYRMVEGMIYFNIQKFLNLLDELETKSTINFKEKTNTTE